MFTALISGYRRYSISYPHVELGLFNTEIVNIWQQSIKSSYPLILVIWIARVSNRYSINQNNHSYIMHPKCLLLTWLYNSLSTPYVYGKSFLLSAFKQTALKYKRWISHLVGPFVVELRKEIGLYFWTNVLPLDWRTGEISIEQEFDGVKVEKQQVYKSLGPIPSMALFGSSSVKASITSCFEILYR